MYFKPLHNSGKVLCFIIKIESVLFVSAYTLPGATINSSPFSLQTYTALHGFCLILAAVYKSLASPPCAFDLHVYLLAFLFIFQFCFSEPVLASTSPGQYMEEEDSSGPDCTWSFHLNSAFIASLFMSHGWSTVTGLAGTYVTFSSLYVHLCFVSRTWLREF